MELITNTNLKQNSHETSMTELLCKFSFNSSDLPSKNIQI